MSEETTCQGAGVWPRVETTAVFDTGHRVCENCGGAMPNRMSRQRNSKGDLVCDNCKQTTAALAMLATDEQRREFRYRLASTVSSILRTFQRTAHDMGDGGIIHHCPFCGSGAVTGGSDGSVECGFCHSVFTVQVQPQNPAMPQMVDGQPFVPPGQPGGDPTEMSAPHDPVADANDANQQTPPGHPSPGDPNPSSKDMLQGNQPPGGAPSKGKDEPPWLKGKDDGDKDSPPSKADSKSDAPDSPPAKGDDDPKKKKDLPPWLKNKASSLAPVEGQRFFTPEGAVLEGDDYLRSLALRFTDDREATLAVVKATREVEAADKFKPGDMVRLTDSGARGTWLVISVDGNRLVATNPSTHSGRVNLNAESCEKVDS